MRSSVARAGGYAGISLLAVTASVFAGATLVAFSFVTILSLVVREGWFFDRMADPAERRSGRLVGLTEYALAATVLAAGVVLDWMPQELFVGTVLLVGVGYLGAELARVPRSDRLTETIGFITLGFLAYGLGHLVGTGIDAVDLAVVGFLSMAGALTGALFRSATWVRHDGIVMVVLALVIGGLYALPAPTLEVVVIAIVTSIILAYLALWIGAASIPGMVSGVLMVFLTIVLGGLAWVAMLVAFFIIGGLATKFRYTDKRSRGVAEPNRGARGTGNVLGNTLAALVALLGFAAVAADSPLEAMFAYAFAGSIATALSDTLSSEIGGLYDRPLLITSLDPVTPGTDGAVTIEGTLAGAVGGAVVGILFWLLGPATVGGGIVVALAGVIGMFVDSLLGAMIEGDVVGNHAVNAVATAVGGLVAVTALALGII